MTPPEEHEKRKPDIIGTPDIELRPERINLREGTIIRTVSGGPKTWPVDPPFIVPEDGYYRAIVDTAKGTATMELVHPNRWSAFTNDELIAFRIGIYSATNLLDPVGAEITAELERRTGSPSWNSLSVTEKT